MIWKALAAVTVLGCAASGGVFLAFSTFTGSALARLPATVGMATMQQINLFAPRSPVFMALLFGPAVLGAALACRMIVSPAPGRALVVSGVVVYVLGVVVMTAAFHVPRNDTLARLDPLTQSADWHPWLRAWILGNHVRAVSGLAAAALVGAGLRCPR